MRSWIRLPVEASFRIGLLAFVVTPAIALAWSLVDVSRSGWLDHGLATLAVHHVVLAVARASLWSAVCLLGLLAAGAATAAGPVPLLSRLAAGAASWALLLVPAQWLAQPALRLLLLQSDHAPLPLQVLVTIPQELTPATAVYVAALILVHRRRESRARSGPAPSWRLFARRPWTAVAGLALAAAIPAADWLRPAPPPGATNLLLVVVDTLRADHLGTYGFTGRPTSPRLDEFARDGVVYENAASAAPWTTASMAAMLTSRYPRRHGFHRTPLQLDPREVTMAEALWARGYRTHAIVSNVCSSSAVGHDAGFDRMDESRLATHMDVTSAALTDLALDWLASNGDRPFFLHLHYLDPHFAYIMHDDHDFDPGYLGPFRASLEHDQFVAALPQMSPADLEFVKASYDSEIAYTDAELGRLFDGLRRLGLYDRTQIVFTADHGEALDDRGDHFVGHGPNVFEELLHVPLIVKNPASAGAGTRVRDRVSTLDIAPTMLRTAGTAFPPGVVVDGRPLGQAGDPSRTVVGETRRDADCAAIYRGQWKLLVDRDEGTSRLFDLASDPREANDVAAGHADVASDLASALQAWERDLGDPGGTDAVFSQAQKERLEGLGYAQ